jgi:hypothetical protein
MKDGILKIVPNKLQKYRCLQPEKVLLKINRKNKLKILLHNKQPDLVNNAEGTEYGMLPVGVGFS